VRVGDTRYYRFLSDFLFTIVSIICVGLFSIITNNSADQEIDKISNQTRPLIVKSIPSSTYMCIGYVALLMGLVYASMVNIKTLVIIGVVTAIYFIYSMPPIRFKRVPVLSKLAISFNSLALILLGYLLLNNNLLQFPKVLLPIFLISYTIAANFIDIKDYEGDRHAGVVTLPGLLGLQKAKFFISAAFICTYASFVLLLKNLEDFYLLLAGGIIQAFFVLRAPYNEKRIFQFHLLSVITLIALVLA
jgi:4-hydroxybenzoate polyprenyltransferase